MFRLLPEQASEFAPKVDWINNLITDISVFFTVAIVGSMIYFAVRYRAKKGVDHETDRIEGSHFLEMVWTVVPTVICIFVAAYGFIIFEEIRGIPNEKDAVTINVTARQWKWDFEYSNGKKTTGEWVIPVDQPVRLVMTSMDVLHSLFVPVMRVKMDVIPKQYTYLWFKPVKTGEFHTFCTEYCGTDHSAMLANLRVVSKAEYQRWLDDNSDAEKLKRMKPSDLGQQLYVSKGCVSCHSLDGSKIVGPSFLKVWGKDEELEGGTTVKVDENYARESMLNPTAKVVKGFPPVMTSFQGLLNDDEIHALIEFIKTVDGTTKIAPIAVKRDDAADANLTPAERGKKIYETRLCITCHSLDGTTKPGSGPSFKGIYGHKAKLTDGSEVDVNEEYVKESVLKPQAKVVEGFQPIMPPFEGQLNDKDITDIIEFLKTQK